MVSADAIETYVYLIYEVDFDGHVHGIAVGA